MQTFLTIFSGVIIFVVGQITVKMVIEPVQEMKKTIEKIKTEVHRNSFEIHNCSVIGESSKKETIDILRNLSAELIAHIELVSFYKISSSIFNLPDKIKITNAFQNLISIANLMNIPTHTKTADHAYELILKNIEELKINLNISLVTGYEMESKKN